jgi:ubiquitin C-terminal hydrolase
VGCAGHYITDVYNPRTKSWLSFDDKLVRTVDESTVTNSPERQRGGYLLFYVHDNCL